ncbi:glycosyltransferase family 2 protein [Caulobacter radicis]|uniref:Glycosyl transferase family A n=1 Tax=Caulobacter radicis TaxID=2172650 RepID=A0A2T9JPK1_9CAUL|nr:glycosyltransferase family A protein [Caulobacter radicis]PVM85556.1 glycosyl transferase family A [Caulobacter radicis]
MTTTTATLDPAQAAPAQASDVVHVTVGVLTFKRPDGIAKLLDSLGGLTMSAERPYRLSVVVVDNDPKGSGRAAVEPFMASSAFQLIYAIEPEPGIPFGRNRAMDEAPADSKFFCFVDDDEWVVPGWLDALLEVQARTGTDCVYGPVEPVYPENPPAYFIKSKVFERKKNEDGARIGYAASNNVMFDLPLFRQMGLRFEERMRHTGGTDYLFFNQAVRKGAKIHWSDAALVYDVVPANRMTWKWVIQRQYRLGNTFAVADQLHGTPARRAYRLVYGAARMALGAVMSPALLISPSLGMRAIIHGVRGAGVVSGILGHSYQEYGKAQA